MCPETRFLPSPGSEADLPGRIPLVRSRRGLLPVDLVMAGYAAVVAAIIIVRAEAIPRAGLLLAFHAAVGLGALLVAGATRRLGPREAILARMAYSVAAIPALFLSLGGIVQYAVPWRGEEALKRIDDFLFLGRNPNVLLDRIQAPVLTEYLQFIYATYYFLPIVLLAGLLLRGARGEVSRSMTAILLSLVISYFGYFAVPATGPAVNVRGLYPWPPYEEELRSGTSTLPGIAFAGEIREALFRAETIQHDCFPSGHTAMSLVVLLLARRYHRGVFRILLVPVASLIFSTMYLRYHYAVDVIAGIALAAFSLAAADRLEAAFRARVAAGDAAGSPPVTGGPPSCSPDSPAGSSPRPPSFR